MICLNIFVNLCWRRGVGSNYLLWYDVWLISFPPKGCVDYSRTNTTKKSDLSLNKLLNYIWFYTFYPFTPLLPASSSQVYLIWPSYTHISQINSLNLLTLSHYKIPRKSHYYFQRKVMERSGLRYEHFCLEIVLIHSAQHGWFYRIKPCRQNLYPNPSWIAGKSCSAATMRPVTSYPSQVLMSILCHLPLLLLLLLSISIIQLFFKLF